MQGSRSPITTQLAVSSRFRIQRKLGSGSVGAVYLAHDVSAERSVALKVIRSDGIGSKDLRVLQREFRAIASLRHPQIAEAYDFGYTEEGRIPFFTREYVAGSPLRPGPPDSKAQANPGEFLKPVLDLLDALDYLHAHDILHLDIHAGNLIVADDDKRGSVLSHPEGPLELPPQGLTELVIRITDESTLTGEVLDKSSRGIPDVNL